MYIKDKQIQKNKWLSQLVMKLLVMNALLNLLIVFSCLPYCSALASLTEGVETPVTNALSEIFYYLCLCFKSKVSLRIVTMIVKVAQYAKCS